MAGWPRSPPRAGSWGAPLRRRVLFYQEEAGRLFVLDPGILCAYLAFGPFPSAGWLMR